MRHASALARSFPAAEGAPVFLEQAFADFITASGKLERSYRDLQAQVAELLSARAQDEQVLHQSVTEREHLLHRMETIVCSVPCGVLLLTAHGEIVQANPEAARLLALAAAELPNLTALLQPDAEDSLSAASSDSHQAGSHEKVLTLASSEGQHWIAFRRVPLDRLITTRDSGAAWLITLQDITARKRAEQERERARNAAALAEVSALLAHEVRNPLASMELFADLLIQAPDRHEEWISHLRAGIRSLAGTVNNVLLLSNAEPAALERLDLAREVPAIVQFLQPLALQAEVQFSFAEPAAPVWVRTNRAALHQLLLNLCTNAFRYTAAHDEVRVSCRTAANGTPLLLVRDTGRGIIPERLGALFEPGVTDCRQRTGLGLAVCDRLMRQHGGRVHVASTPGFGSTFTLEFVAA